MSVTREPSRARVHRMLAAQELQELLELQSSGGEHQIWGTPITSISTDACLAIDRQA